VSETTRFAAVSTSLRPMLVICSAASFLSILDAIAESLRPRRCAQHQRGPAQRVRQSATAQTLCRVARKLAFLAGSLRVRNRG